MESPSDDISLKRRGTPRDASRRISKFHVGSFVILLVGATISGALIVNQNISSVAEAVYRIGWGFVPVLVFQALSIILHGFGWRFLFRSGRPGFTSSLLVLRGLRESINYILPVGHVGGEMVAAHLLMARGEEKNRAVAGIVADKTLEVLGLFLFVLAGIVVLFETGGNRSSKVICNGRYPLDSSLLFDLNLSKIGARSNLKARDFRRCFSRLNGRMS